MHFHEDAGQRVDQLTGMISSPVILISSRGSAKAQAWFTGCAARLRSLASRPPTGHFKYMESYIAMRNVLHLAIDRSLFQTSATLFTTNVHFSLPGIAHNE